MGLYEFVDLLTLLSPVILLIGVFIGFYYYKSLDAIHKSITYYLLAMLIVDQLARLFDRLFNNNLYMLLIYSLIEIILISVFYFTYLLKSRHRVIKGIGLIAIAYIIWEILAIETKSKDFQPYSKVVDNFMVILLALAFFQEKINNFKESKWENFQLNIVVLLFFSLTLIFFLPYNFLVNESTGLKFYFWLGILFTTIFFYSYLTWCIWRNGRSNKRLAFKNNR